jgi:hypothetical protein
MAMPCGQRKGTGRRNLLAQKVERLGVEVFFQDFDREDLADDLFIGGQVHHPHSAYTELALDAVAAGKSLTDRQALVGASFQAVRGCPHRSVIWAYAVAAAESVRIDFGLEG